MYNDVKHNKSDNPYVWGDTIRKDFVSKKDVHF